MGTQGKCDPGDGRTVQWTNQETEKWEMEEVGVGRIGQPRELGNEGTERINMYTYIRILY
jgi:hypothetical protein